MNNYCNNNLKSENLMISSQRKMNDKEYIIFISKNNLNDKNENKYNNNNPKVFAKMNKNQKKEDQNTNYNFIFEKKYDFSYPKENSEFSENDIESKDKEKYFDEIINTESSLNKSEKEYSKKSISVSERSSSNKTNKMHKHNPDIIYPYEKKDYDENDLDGLDYDEALIYDKRTFYQLFCKQLKERQLIANTFFVKDNLKPFSIKLIVFIFNFSCYLVINGFLFNEEYVMKILRRKSKNFYYFLVDSTTRIVYSSIIGAIVNIIVGLLFRAEKQIRRIQSKYSDNKIILHGEIVKIYKSTKCLYIGFTIFNILAMLVFLFYLFCFCGVYRNCQADWFEGCFIVFYIMQLIPVLVSLFLAIMRKAGLVCKVECMFKINSWIIDNI